MLALLRFHLHVGTRLALRAAAPLAGLPLVLVLLQEDPSGALRGAAAWLLGPRGGLGPGILLSLVCLALASWASPRVTAGLAGWPRHLPASGTAQRLAAIAAVLLAQSPLVIGLAFLAPAAAVQPGGLSLARVASVPLLVAAAAVAVWPGTRSWRSRPLAAAALAAAAAGAAAAEPVALILVVAAGGLAGPLPSHSPARRGTTTALPLSALVFVRALGPPAALGAIALSLVPVGAMAALRLNNELPPAVAAGAARFGGGIGVVLLLASLGERLAVRRPVWPWARSLPVSATRRAAEDAALLALPCLVPLLATARLDTGAALTVAACLPSLTLLAACALRGGSPADSGIATFLLVAGVLLVAWVALLPWLAFVSLAAAPLTLRAAARRDRRQKVGHWDERHHRAVGDPLSWSAR